MEGGVFGQAGGYGIRTTYNGTTDNFEIQTGNQSTTAMRVRISRDGGMMINTNLNMNTSNVYNVGGLSANSVTANAIKSDGLTSNTLYISSSAGIGTTTPEAPLHVYSETDSVATIGTKNSAGLHAYMRFVRDDSNG